ncbi:MAG: hypothetical protein O3B87_00145 [bacterium]|nr:hypothetical protein [bacterium]
MRNIFILYMPVNNYEAMVHYTDTIVNKVDQERIFNFLEKSEVKILKDIFGNKKLTIWGSRDSGPNRSKFNKMKPGDDIMIVEGKNIKLLGKIAYKTVSNTLSAKLWKNIKNGSIEGWNLIYFIANPIEINLPFSEFNKLLDYEENYTLKGFTNVSDERLKLFYNHYDNLYDVLMRIKTGEKPYEVMRDKLKLQNDEKNLFQNEVEIDEEVSPKELTEHVRMQWALVNMGLKAGTRVWVPKNDQGKITKEYSFSDFEKEFTSGIDVDARYVENIDVVWKEGFKINAAFEVENSTSVYSGLLRFSDLKIVAPNSSYPLIIVAPEERREKVRRQVTRPTFNAMKFNRLVKFLSYEMIDEVDKFTAKNTSVNSSVLLERAEGLVS